MYANLFSLDIFYLGAITDMQKKCLSFLSAVLSVLVFSSCTSKGFSPEYVESSVAEASAEQEMYDAGEVIPLDCDPLTGEKMESDAIQGQRPVAVMLDNNRTALPQTGISAASIVYEMVTEGGIPRLMAVYRNTAALRTVGPVRSTRDQFVQLAVPENMLLLHIGSSVYATNMLEQLNYPTVDGIELGTVTYVFDTARAATGYGNEHCWYVGDDGAEAGAAQKGIPTTGTVTSVFQFVSYEAEPRLPEDGTASLVEFSFSQNVPVSFRYSEADHNYRKSEYGEELIDLATNAPVSYTNVFLLSCNVSLKSDGLCTDFDFSGGSGAYFYGGHYQLITWEKQDISSPLIIKDTDGNTLSVNVGTSYVAFVENRAIQRSLLLDGVNPFAAQAANSGSLVG